MEEDEKKKYNPLLDMPAPTFAEGRGNITGDDGLTVTAPVAQPQATPVATPVPGSGMEYMNKLFGNSYLISPEEEQRRMKKARTLSMIGNLGNAIGGFANLLYAGKGAPAMKVPEAINPDYAAFQDRVNKARNEAYAKLQAQDQLRYTRERQAALDALDREEKANKAKLNAAQVGAYEALARQRDSSVALNEVKALLEQGKFDEAKRKLDAQIEHWNNQDANAASRTGIAAANSQYYTSGGTGALGYTLTTERDEDDGYGGTKHVVETKTKTPGNGGGTTTRSYGHAGGGSGSNSSGKGNGGRRNRSMK